MKLFFRIVVACIVLLFFYQPVFVSAQQDEVEVFFTPAMAEVVEITHEVDLKRYRVEWGVARMQMPFEVVVPRLPFSGVQNVNERFVNNLPQYDEINNQQGRSKQEITITWNGKSPDNTIMEPGAYRLTIYTLQNNGRVAKESRHIPVTIVPPLQPFNVVLSDMRLNKRENKMLSVGVSFPQQQASSWRIIIRDNNEVEIENRILIRGVDSEFPGFFWQNYSNLKLEQYTVTVEATDRAGNRVSSRRHFWIIDKETASEAREQELAEALAEKDQLLTQLDEEIAELVRKWEEEKKNLIGGITDDDLDEHIVSSGETLRSISDHFYGTSFLWGIIYEFNRADFPSIDASPHVIVPFMPLRVPRREALERLGIIGKQ